MAEYADNKLAMLVAETVDKTTSRAIPLNNCAQHWHGVEFAPDTTSGVVVVETAASRDFPGPWTEILSVDASVALSGDITFPGPGGFVRHRIGTVVAGGAAPSVSSWCKRILIGN